MNTQHIYNNYPNTFNHALSIWHFEETIEASYTEFNATKVVETQAEKIVFYHSIIQIIMSNETEGQAKLSLDEDGDTDQKARTDRQNYVFAWRTCQNMR